MSTFSQKSPKQVVSVEILHLDDLGYGPEGKQTRREWREACLGNLLAGREAFNVWQNQWIGQVRHDLPRVLHGYLHLFADGSSQTFLEFGRRPAYSIDFSGHKFEDHLDARSFQFARPVLFAGSSFIRFVSFDGVDFGGDADFSNAAFNSEASFVGTNFTNGVNFGGVNFSRSVDFTRAVFLMQATFIETVFHKSTWFNSTAFNGSLFFGGSTFLGGVDFIKTMFNSECRFSPLEFEKGKSTTFLDHANFENAVFENVGHFERVRFAKQVPSFLGVDNATTRLEFADDSYFPKQDRTGDAVTRLGHLKRLADEHGQTDQALNFNALELHAKAGLATTSGFTKLVTWVYGAVSDYGRSFTRPVATYVALLLITLLLATGHAAFSLPAKDCYGARWQILTDLLRTTAPCSLALDDKLHISGYRAAAEYTLYRAAGVLDFSDNGKATDAVARRLFGQPIEPWWMRVWGVFKAIASTALLFLTALGLRNKYRIK